MFKNLAIWTVMFFIRVSLAQNELPQCAIACATDAASAAGCSGLTDMSCLCTASSSFLSAAEQCAGLLCSPSDQALALLAFNQLCGTASSTRSKSASSSVSTSTASSRTSLSSSSFNPSTIGNFSETKSGSTFPPLSGSGVTTVITTFSNPPVTLTFTTILPVTSTRTVSSPASSGPSSTLGSSSASSSLGTNSTSAATVTAPPSITVPPPPSTTVVFSSQTLTPTSSSAAFPMYHTSPILIFTWLALGACVLGL